MGASDAYLQTLTRLSEAKASGQVDAIRAAAQAHAEAQRANAGLYGQSIANIGQMVSQYPEQQAKLQQIKNQAANTELERQRLQMQTTKEQREQADADQVKSIFKDTNGDLDAAIPKIMAVNPELGVKFQNSNNQAKTAALTYRKVQLDGQLAELNAKADLFGPVKDQDTYSQQLLTAHHAGIDVSQLPTDYEQAKPQIDALVQGTKSGREQIEQNLKLLDEKRKQLATEAENANKTADNERAAAAAAALQTERAADNARADKQLAVSQGQLALGQQRESREAKAAASANAPAVEIKPGTAEYQVAKDLASGKLTMVDFQRLYGRAEKNAGLRQGIYYAATQMNPDFQPAQFELGFKMAGNPQIAQRVVAINAIGPVMTRMEELIDKSGNTDIPALNSLLNAAKFQFGNQTVTNFRQLQTLLGDEVGNALGVGTGSDLKTKLGIDLINPNLSPGNFRSNMEQARTALQQRRSELYKIQEPYAPKDSQPPTPTTIPAAMPAPQGAVTGRVGPYTYVVK